MADTLDVHLRLGHIRRTTQQARTQLPTNLRALGGVGPVLLPPPAGSRSVIVNGHTTRKVHTTGAQLQYLTHQKGWDSQDAFLFTREGQAVDRQQFIAQAQQDPWQFRFSVNPEQPPQYLPLQPLIESLMARVEKDLGRSIDWVAAVHHDTDRPHAHIIMRGRTLQGQPLVILNDYLKHGLKYRAMHLATLLLGPLQAETHALTHTPTDTQQLSPRQESKQAVALSLREGNADHRSAAQVQALQGQPPRMKLG